MISLAGCSPARGENNDTATACDGETACSVDESVDNGFTEISMDDAIDYFVNKKSGVLYFGFETCPWCIEAVPILEQVANQQSVEINYIKTRDEDRNLLYTDEQKTKITEYISDYMSDNDEGVLTLFVPLVLVVKDGVVLDGHEGTVEGHDAKERTMTDEEKSELEQIYTELLEQGLN